MNRHATTDPSRTLQALHGARDWAATPIGPPAGWPQPLRTLVGVMVASAQPMFIAWGDEGILLYNDAYRPLLGLKHPALGEPFFDVWSEVRSSVEPLFDRVRAGESVHMDDLALVLERNGLPEETHFAFSYTPVRDDHGTVVGLFCACLETTAQVLATRRTADERERLQQLFAQAPGGMALLRGPNHIVELTNKAYHALVGQRDVVGRPIRDALPEVAGQGFFALLDRVYRSGEAYVGNAASVRLQRTPEAPAETRLVDFVFQPVTDAEGRVNGIFVQTTDVTARLNAERRLREQGALHRQILDSVVDEAIISTDLDGLITSWNAVAESMLGWPAEAMHGQPLDRLHTPEDLADDWPARLRRSARAQGRIDDERWLLRRNGQRFWSSGETVPLRDEHGHAVGYVKVLRDRTAERLSAEALMASQARLRVSQASLRLATDVAEIGIWDLDMATDTLTWSDRTKAMFGLSPGMPCTMRDFYAGLHPEDRAATSAAFAAAIDPATRAIYDVEYRTIGREDGVVRWVAARGRGLFDDGVCVRALGTAIDITARKSASARQALLLDVGDRLRGVGDPRAVLRSALGAIGAHLSVSRVGFGLIQPDDLHMDIDTAHVADGVAPLEGRYAVDTFGQHAERELRAGRTVAIDDVHADPALAGTWWQRLGVGAVLVVPVVRGGRLAGSVYLHALSPRRWAADDIALVEDAAGRVWDAMERLRAEDDLRELNTTLEARVEQRTAELRRTEEALRHAQKLEAVGQLTGGIAHDFNNLLTGISGSLELLRRKAVTGDDAQAQRYIGMATASAQRAAALTQRLLAFARRQPLAPKPVEANALVRGMEELLQRTIGPEVVLDLQLWPALWPTLCDPNQLESAILNLAINARDAMPDGGRLTIRTANLVLDAAQIHAQGGHDLSPGDYVEVAVSDTGVGMTPEVIAHAFEPFFTTKPIGQGTGLGLSMLYGFAKQSHGHVLLTSSPGQGSLFRMILPRYQGLPDADADVPAGAAPDRAGSDETVLVVDDEPAVRLLIVETLRDLGYRTVETGDGASGLALLQSPRRFDLLVTDVGLPGLNGRQLADAGRQSRPHLKVLFITGYAGKAAVGNDRLEPGMELLAKPFAMETLARTIRDLLGKAGA